MLPRLLLPLLVLGLALACGSTPPPGDTSDLPGRPALPDDPATRPYLLERVDQAAIAQLYADGFVTLTLPQKVLAYHLYRAALAGRDIYYDQRHRWALEMREIVEHILHRPGDADAATLREITRYAKLFWLNSGPYENLSSRKFVLKTTPAAPPGAGGV